MPVRNLENVSCIHTAQGDAWVISNFSEREIQVLLKKHIKKFKNDVVVPAYQVYVQSPGLFQ